MTESSPGVLLGSGRSAEVFDIGAGRVLRRYRDGRPARLVEAEAGVMAAARAAGVPVPEVFEVTGPGIVMERVDGPTMLAVLARRPWTATAQSRLLARLHGLVHQVPSSALAGLSLPLPFADGPGTGDVLLHQDLHPANVILTRDGPVIIDWERAACGPAAADVAMTWAIIAFSEIPASRAEAVAARATRALFTRSFLRAAGPEEQAWRLAAIRLRLANQNTLPSEVARLEAWAARASADAALD
jgi:aminoglycoside phosphotransferase (APT) family kinase protein